MTSAAPLAAACGPQHVTYVAGFRWDAAGHAGILLLPRVAPQQAAAYGGNQNLGNPLGASVHARFDTLLTHAAAFLINVHRHLESLTLKGHHRLKPAQLACLGQLQGSLTHLDLQGCSSLTQSVLAHLQPLTGLQALVLSGERLGGGQNDSEAATR